MTLILWSQSVEWKMNRKMPQSFHRSSNYSNNTTKCFWTLKTPMMKWTGLKRLCSISEISRKLLNTLSFNIKIFRSWLKKSTLNLGTKSKILWLRIFSGWKLNRRLRKVWLILRSNSTSKGVFCQPFKRANRKVKS